MSLPDSSNMKVYYGKEMIDFINRTQESRTQINHDKGNITPFEQPHITPIVYA